MNRELQLKVTNDYIFKKIFAKKGNESILKDLLNSILQIKIKSIEVISDVNLERQLESNKLGILDLKAKLDEETIVNIEIQIINRYNMIERTLFYWSGLYYNVLQKGVDYKEIKKAQEEYEYLTGDEEERRIAFLREKAIRDENSIFDAGKDIGFKSGEEHGIKKGKKEGIEIGREQGIEIGKEQGIEQNKKEIANSMLKENIPIETIMKITKLSREEIEKLEKEM